MSGVSRRLSLGLMVLALPALGVAGPVDETEYQEGEVAQYPVLRRIVESLASPGLGDLATETLERNPGVAALRAGSVATAKSAARAGKWPDPVAGVAAFMSPPETRVGPQRLSVTVTQKLPWGSAPGLAEQAVHHRATAVDARAEALGLEVLTEIRRVYHELAFLDREEEILESFIEHLRQHEEVSRARYATGVGPGQSVVKLQAELTRVETELVTMAARRATLESRINGLRDRPSGTPIPSAVRPVVQEVFLDREQLLQLARKSRPELSAAKAEMARAEVVGERATRQGRPDFSIGLTWAMVDPRDDAPGQVAPPPDNGQDIFGIVGSISLPLWRKRQSAGVEAAVSAGEAAAESLRQTEAQIREEIEALVLTIPLHWRRIRLLDGLLVVQAGEALESAKAGYVTGSLNALDLLDAEHVLFDARIAVARAKADYLISIAELEGALAWPLPSGPSTSGSKS